MIISDLVDEFDRLAKNPDAELNQDGYCFGKIDNLVVIDDDGHLKEIVGIENPIREKLPENLCPGGVKKSILYDSFEYFFGLKLEKNKFVVAVDGKRKDGLSKFENFKNANTELLNGATGNIATAILKFLNSWNVEENVRNENFFVNFGTEDEAPRIFKGNFSFCLNNVGNKCYLDSEIVKRVDDKITKRNSDVKPDGVCCITGKLAKIAEKHKSFSGSQNYLISVDNDSKSFHSYNKTWCFDSPVSEEIMNKYTAVLNYFYRNGSKNKMSMGDDVLFFWANADEGYEDEILSMLGQSGPDKNEEVESKVNSSLEQIKNGVKPDEFKTDEKSNFYILILSKNSARFSVRKYLTTTFGAFRDNVLQHYADMQLVGVNSIVPIWQILNATVSSSSNDKPNPNFNGALADAIFMKNVKYPTEVFAQMIERFKTDNSGKPIVRILTNNRVAFIKAYLVRKNRMENKKEEIKMSLNYENKDEAYLLGRLFAVMEKAQEDAIKGANSTIKDRFFASACSCPASVFPTLLMGYQNHIAKLENGKIRYEQIMQEIFEKLADKFPKQLDLDGQGRFIIGYYQQHTSLWTKKSDTETAEKKEN
jgi:CRISPR-associated protein Csd1